MPATNQPPSQRETYMKFVEALAEGKWGNALDCVAPTFRGTISDMPGDEQLSIQDYTEGMKRLRSAFDHFGRTRGNSHFSEEGNTLRVRYTLDMVFAHELKPRRGSRDNTSLPANGKQVLIPTTDHVTFDEGGKILTLVSTSKSQETWAQMNA